MDLKVDWKVDWKVEGKGNQRHLWRDEASGGDGVLSGGANDGAMEEK